MSSHGTRGRVRGPGIRAVRTWVLAALLALGVWLSIAPFALGYQTDGVPLRATLNDCVVGLGVLGFALVGLTRPER